MKTKKPEAGISLREVGMDAVYLISCALHGRVPAAEAVENPDALFSFCKGHSITAMVAMALESYWQMSPPEDPEQVKPWKEAKEKSVRKNILLNAERERILRYLDSIGCWYLPLKGSFLQHDYPKFGMRQMSDNDILFDTRYDSVIRDFMCGSGYTVKSFRRGGQDEYIKPPVYNFEMHRSLFSPAVNSKLWEYYNDAKRLMVKDGGNSGGYHLGDEDFYVYMTAHAFRHFSDGGTGIRSLVDVYVFLQKHGEALDWDYVKTQLQKLEVLDYEQRCRQLSRKLFVEPRREISLTLEERELLEYFLGAGTYGNKKQAVENALGRMEQEGDSGGIGMKLRYFWRRLFPTMEFMAQLEPDLLQHKWKLPLAYGKRLLKALFANPMRIVREFIYLIRSKRSRK